jgi:hypothetical protein
MTQKSYEVPDRDEFGEVFKSQGNDEFIGLVKGEYDDQLLDEDDAFTRFKNGEGDSDVFVDGDHMFFREPKLVDLGIEFGDTRFGLLYFTLTLGDQSVQMRFSDVFDPMLDLKCWLEAIVIGVQRCSFAWDAEGPDYKFDFERITFKRWRFTAGNAYLSEGEEPAIRNWVDRRQLVVAFYRGFLDFEASPEFNKYEWEPRPNSNPPFDSHEGTPLINLKSELIENFLANP